jgi:amino acid transporter
VGYVGFFWPGAAVGAGRVAVILLVVTGLMVVNLTGVRNAARVGNVITVAKLLPLTLFIGAGLFFLHPGNYALGPRPAYGDFSVSVLLLVYAFSGFEMATIPGGEVEDPRRDMPRALLTAIAFVVVFYFLIQLVAIGTLPELAGSTRPLADAGSRFLGALGGGIISAGALVSIVGNLNVIMLVGARLPFAMAQRRELPSFMAATHPRYHTPHVSILLTGVVVLVLTLSGTFVYAATVSVIARLLSYGATCAALPVLRRRSTAPVAVFRAPAGIAASIAALLLTGWLLTNITGRQARDAVIAAALGILIYLAPRLLRRGPLSGAGRA